jgi:hypothetical protein
MPNALRFLLTLPVSLALAAGLPAQPPSNTTTGPKAPATIADQTFEEWFKKLSDPDPSTRDAAVRVIPAFGSAAEKAIPKITSMMVSDVDNTVKVSALLTVTMYPFENQKLIDAVVKNVQTMLSSTQTAIRIQAALAAGRLGNHAKPMIGSLIDYTLNNQGSYEVRRAGAVALGQVGFEKDGYPDKRAVNALLSALSDPCLVVRLEIVKSLLYLGSPGSLPESDSERKSLMQRIEAKGAKHEADPAMQLMLRGCILRLDAVLLASTEQMQADEQMKPIRSAAITRTGKYLDDVAKELTNPRLRITAVDVLGIQGKAGLPKINGLLAGLRPEENKPENYEFMAHCLHAIGNLGPDARLPAEETIKRLTMHSDPTLKNIAEGVLKKLQAGPMLKKN